MIGYVSSAIASVAPWPILLVGIFLGIRGDHHVNWIKKYGNLATWFALVSAAVAALVFVFVPQHSLTFLAIKLPAGFKALTVTTLMNPITIIVFLLVSFMGMIVSRFSLSYMAGDAHEGRFYKWLSLTVGVFLLLILTNNIWAFWILFVISSLSLHQLLMFYRERPLAIMAARKKFLLSRLADLALLIAFILIARTTKQVEFSGISRWLLAWHAALPVSLEIAAGLIAIAAIFKSGVFPLHGWLIQVMEAPTQVSALLHAGLIYAGAFLLLRTSFLISDVSWTWILLVIVGLLSAAMASLMMMTETNIKESLAYSTSAQLGFMLMECGLGLYSVAVLHIVAHSVYKAHAFLSSGSVVDNFRGPTIKKVKSQPPLIRAELSIVMSGIVTFGVALLFGVRLQNQPTLLTIGVIVTVAMSQLLLQGFNGSGVGAGTLLARVALFSLIICTAYFGLHDLSSYVLGSSVPSDSRQAFQVPIWLLGLIVVTFISLFHIQQLVPRMQKSRFWQALYVNIYNGMYVDLWLSQLLSLDVTKKHRAIGTNHGSALERTGR
jgi:NAD(P)H-quinone oxidoreductase subunit 5